jgi:hypothetical protein
MRDFLNGILNWIATDSLTDAEYATITATLPLYDQATYDDLSRILLAREAVSTLQSRLVMFYGSKGVTVTPAKTGSSNIYIGDVL